MNIDKIIREVQKYKEASRLIELAKADQEAARAALIEELDARGVSELIAGADRVRVTVVTSTRIDAKALRKIAPALADDCTKVTTARRFTIN